jgi:hypothetical protein
MVSESASDNLKDISIVTPLELNERLSISLTLEFFLKEKMFKKLDLSKLEEHSIK